MKDVLKELKKLGDIVATSLGFMVIAVAIGLIIVLVMREIYCHPPKEYDRGVYSKGWFARPDVMMRMFTNPMSCPASPPKVYHK